MPVLVVDALIAQACEAAQLDNFGSDSFREGLAVYCESVNAEAQLNDVGAAAIPANIVASLVNRLNVVDWSRRHPEVADERIDAPIVVIGMFRAGTTFLSALLERDPRNRALLRWEAGDSVPPPTADALRSDPRVDLARAGNDMLEQLNPNMRAIHHEEPDGPTECIAVMSQDFKSLSWEAISNVPTYSRWLLETDQRSAYEYHRDVLRVLQHGGARGRWTLKSPHHAIALDALTGVYPDARLVLLHRDPVELCGSVCSLIATLSATFSDADHRRYIAEHWTTMLEDSIRRVDDFRARHPSFGVVDVQYDDLVRDPLATVATIYEQCAGPVVAELDDDARNAMAAYADSHPKNALGVHGYALDDFGLDPHEISERFAGYVERYGVRTHGDLAC